MAAIQRNACPARVVFIGAHKQPSYVVESYRMPTEQDLNEGEILIKVRCSTICDSDVEALFSPGSNSYGKPRVLGHEGIGEILYTKRIADRPNEIKVGDRVVYSLWDTCNCCEMCAQGYLDHCLEASRYGYGSLFDSSGLNGSFASHLIIKKGTAIAKVPDCISDLVASSINCSLATALHAVSSLVSLHQIPKEGIAVVQGADLSGIYACTLLYEAGYKQVYCHDSRPEKLKFVDRFKAIPILVNHSSDIKSLKPGAGSADVVLKISPDTGLVSTGIDLLKAGGCYVMMAMNATANDNGVHWNKVTQKNLTIKGVSGYNEEHLRASVEFLAKTVKTYPYHVLLGPQFSIHDFPSAISIAMSDKYYRIPIANVI